MAEQKEQSTRDRIRSATLGKKDQFRTETVEVNGVQVALKQPSVGEREEIFAAIRDEQGNLDHVKLLTWGVVKLAYVPGENQRVFDDMDYDELVKHPTNSWVDKLGESVLNVLNVEADEGND